MNSCSSLEDFCSRLPSFFPYEPAPKRRRIQSDVVELHQLLDQNPAWVEASRGHEVYLKTYQELSRRYWFSSATLSVRLQRTGSPCLPPEVIQEVFRKMPVPALLKASSVCRLWSEEVQLAILYRLNEERCSLTALGVPPYKTADCFTKFPSGIRYLEASPRGLEALSKGHFIQCEGLQRLTIVSEDMHTISLPHLPNLRYLKLECAALKTFELPPLGQLEDVRISAPAYTGFLTIPALPALRQLRIYMAALNALQLSSLPELQLLKIIGLSVSQMVIESMPSLKVLRLYSNHLKRFYDQPFPKLETLLLFGKSFEMIHLSSSTLKKLALRVSNRYALALSCSSLKKLEISNPQLNELSLSSLPQLLQLNINAEVLNKLTLGSVPSLKIVNIHTNRAFTLQHNETFHPETLQLNGKPCTL